MHNHRLSHTEEGKQSHQDVYKRQLAHQGTFMVEVLEDAVRMRGVCVEVGIVSRGLVLCAVPIQAGKRHVAGGMVVYYIENDGQMCIRDRLSSSIIVMTVLKN